MRLDVTARQIPSGVEAGRLCQEKCGGCPVDAVEFKCQAGVNCPLPHRPWQRPESKEAFSMGRRLGCRELWSGLGTAQVRALRVAMETKSI